MTALAQRIDRVAERELRRGGHVGLVVGALADGEQAVRGYGAATRGERTPPDGASIFEIGSITKVFTALVLADMADEGTVRLEEPVRDLLPAGMRVPSRDGREITLEDLATHAAGLPRLPPGLFRRSLRERDNPYAGFTTGDLYASLARVRLRRAPGTRSRYSNFGAGLLGHALVQRAGVPYEELVRTRICMPLGMDDTLIAVPPERRARLVPGHSRRGAPVPGWDLPALAGAGALRSTGGDLLRFVRANVRPPDSRLGAAMRLTHEPRVRAARGVAVGLGWHVLPLQDAPVIAHWHNGGTGGYRSFAGFVEQRRTAVVVLGNSARSVDRLAVRLLSDLSAG